MLDWVSATGGAGDRDVHRSGLGAGQRLVGQLGGQLGRAPLQVGLDVQRDDIQIVTGEDDPLQDPQARSRRLAPAVIGPPPAR